MKKNSCMLDGKREDHSEEEMEAVSSPYLRKEKEPMAAGSYVVYIGSHSHLFLAVLVECGEVLWRTKLGGRVESSACSSVCGDYVVVGKDCN